MRFANASYLWLLLIFPVMIGYLLLFREKDIPGFRLSSLKKMPGAAESPVNKIRLLLPGMLRIIALCFLILALARPQKGLKSSEMTTKATDIMICLDASQSMLSVDFKPSNRFDMAKSVIADFIKGREFDRLGLIIFAEEAITQCPLTLDRTALLDLLSQAVIGVVPANRTAIGDGLALSVSRLKNSTAKSKVIALVTDGANNAGTIDPLTAAKTAATYGIKIYTIGAGSPDGGLMPVDNPFYGHRLVPFKTDLDEDLLLRIASETGGKYFRATSSDKLKIIFKDIDSMEKTDIKVKEYIDYEELYWGFLLAAVMLVFLELITAKTFVRSLP